MIGTNKEKIRFSDLDPIFKVTRGLSMLNIQCSYLMNLPYFLGYKTDFFSFQNNPKDLDPSYKTDLDL